MKEKIEMMLEEAEHDSEATSVRYTSEDILGEVKELINDNSPFGISWNELRKEILTPEEIAESDDRIRSPERLQQIRDEHVLHKVKSVKPLKDYKLQVQFEEESVKIYDVSLLFDKWSEFKIFIDEPDLFETVKVDNGGYGVIWNDELDLAANELYENGITI